MSFGCVLFGLFVCLNSNFHIYSAGIGFSSKGACACGGDRCESCGDKLWCIFRDNKFLNNHNTIS